MAAVILSLAGAAAYKALKSRQQKGGEMPKKKRKPLSGRHRMAIALGLRGKKRKRGVNKLIGETNSGRAARIGAVAAGVVGGGVLLSKRRGVAKSAGSSKFPPIEDPWSGDYQKAALVKSPIGSGLAKSSRAVGRGAGISSAAAAIGYGEGIVAAATDVGRAYLPVVKKGGAVVASKSRQIGGKIRSQAGQSLKSGIERDRAARAKLVSDGWVRDRKARKKLASQLISTRKKILGFSRTPRILEFSSTAEFRRKRLSAAHKRKISQALKGKRRSVQATQSDPVQSIQRLSSAWERGTQGIENAGRAFQVVNDSLVKRRLAQRQLGLGEVNRTTRTLILGGSVVGRILRMR